MKLNLHALPVILILVVAICGASAQEAYIFGYTDETDYFASSLQTIRPAGANPAPVPIGSSYGGAGVRALQWAGGKLYALRYSMDGNGESWSVVVLNPATGAVAPGSTRPITGFRPLDEVAVASDGTAYILGVYGANDTIGMQTMPPTGAIPAPVPLPLITPNTSRKHTGFYGLKCVGNKLYALRLYSDWDDNIYTWSVVVINPATGAIVAGSTRPVTALDHHSVYSFTVASDGTAYIVGDFLGLMTIPPTEPNPAPVPFEPNTGAAALQWVGGKLYSLHYSLDGNGGSWSVVVLNPATGSVVAGSARPVTGITPYSGSMGDSFFAVADGSQSGVKVPWGVKATITPTNGTPWEDFLVAVESNKLILGNDLTWTADATSFTVGAGRSMSTIQRIDVVPQPTPVLHFSQTYGYNKYASNISSAYELAVKNNAGQAVPCYLSGSGWNLVIAGFSQFSTPIDPETNKGVVTTGKFVSNQTISTLYAIPRCKPPSDWRRARTQVEDDLIGGTIIAKARLWSLPPQIAFGKLWHESKSGNKSSAFRADGWNQFGFYTKRSSAPGIPFVPTATKLKETLIAVDDPAGDEWTLVTYDGGIGMAQITGTTALDPRNLAATNGGGGTRPASAPVLTHLFKLAADTAYNIECGAYVMDSKRRSVQYKNKQIGETAGLTDRRFLENWYNVVWAYNGIPPSSGVGNPYPDSILGVIQTGGGGLWEIPSPALSKYAVKLTTGNYIWQQLPTLGENAITKFGHADIDSDGEIDVVLSSPKVGLAATGDTLLVQAVPKAGVTVSKINAVVSTVANTGTVPLQAVQTMTLVPIGTNQFRAPFTAPLPAGQYIANFSVTLNGPNLVGPATGATYRFAIRNITGHVYRESTTTALPGVTLKLTATGMTGLPSTTSSSSGLYSFRAIAGTYVVTPSKTGFTFTPALKTVDITTANASGQDFTSSP